MWAGICLGATPRVSVTGAVVTIATNNASVDALLRKHLQLVHMRADRVFAVLMVVQWVGVVTAALVLTPRTWVGRSSWTHPHVFTAACIGGLLAVPPIVLALRRPGRVATRYTIAMCQMLFSGLLIHLTGGRIETHFHIFGSLAFLAFYRDWRLLAPATFVIATDHVLRGLFWPSSIFGVTQAAPWRALEHAGWVLFEDVFLVISCVRGVSELRQIAQVQVDLQAAQERTEAQVQERTLDLEQAQHQLRKDGDLLTNIVNNIPCAVSWKDRDGRYLGCNDLFAAANGLALCSDIFGRSDHELPWSSEDAAAEREADLEVFRTGRVRLNVEHSRHGDSRSVVSLLTSRVPLRDETGEVAAVLAISTDITERKQLEAQLAQSQKLESIGQLAAGIAHEINTPVQFISDNVRFLREQFGSILNTLTLLVRHRATIPSSPEAGETQSQVDSALVNLDLAFTQTEVPLALDQSLDGLARISTIVLAMKDFARPAMAGKELADLNGAITSTATVCGARWRDIAELDLDLDSELPDVPCLLAEFNQVVLNLIVNASDAIAERCRGSGVKGHIRISTRRVGGTVEVRITDDGCGVPDALRSKVFSPFFTTKPVGKGTGQGLAISRNIIVARHGGTLTFETIEGHGTTFIVTMPLGAGGDQQSAPAAQREAA